MILLFAEIFRNQKRPERFGVRGKEGIFGNDDFRKIFPKFKVLVFYRFFFGLKDFAGFGVDFVFVLIAAAYKFHFVNVDSVIIIEFDFSITTSEAVSFACSIAISCALFAVM